MSNNSSNTCIVKNKSIVSLNEVYKLIIRGEKNDEKITYDKISSGIKFKNRGLLHGMYEYSFLIENEEISITPQIRIFKTSWWRFYNINIDVNVYENNEIWDADIFINVNNHIYQETFNDIENDIIEFRVE